MNAHENKFVAVMITPFNLKAKVDLDVVSALIEFYLAAGVKGFFANCLSSEMYSISEDERLELTAHIVRYVNGRAPVVATGSFSPSSLTVGSTTLTNTGYFDAWLTQYNSSGTLRWALSFGGSTGNESGTGVATDASSNVYVCGTFASSSMVIGTTTLTNAGTS